LQAKFIPSLPISEPNRKQVKSTCPNQHELPKLQLRLCGRISPRPSKETNSRPAIN
jgi:hypothetical protein